MRKLFLILAILILLPSCATTWDLKKLEAEVTRQEQDSINRDSQLFWMFKGLADAYNQHIDLFHSGPSKPESTNLRR